MISLSRLTILQYASDPSNALALVELPQFLDLQVYAAQKRTVKQLQAIFHEINDIVRKSTEPVVFEACAHTYAHALKEVPELNDTLVCLACAHIIYYTSFESIQEAEKSALLESLADSITKAVQDGVPTVRKLHFATLVVHSPHYFQVGSSRKPNEAALVLNLQLVRFHAFAKYHPYCVLKLLMI